MRLLVSQDVHVSGVRHECEGPVDRGESDVVPALLQGRMDLLGAAETVELREQVGDIQALPRRSSRGASRPAMVHGSEALDVSLFDSRLELVKNDSHC